MVSQTTGRQGGVGEDSIPKAWEAAQAFKEIYGFALRTKIRNSG